MSLNVKRGFNRLYLVLALLWAAYWFVWYPALQTRQAWEQHRRDCITCGALPAGQPDCFRDANQMLQTSLESWTFKNAWRLEFLIAILPSLG